MPRGKRSNAAENVMDMTQSQARHSQEAGGSNESQLSQVSNTQAQKAAEKMSTAEFQRKVSDMVRYLLFSDRKKVGIKRTDLIKNVMKEHSRAFNLVFKEASQQLLDKFGYKVVSMLTDDGKMRGYTLITAVETPTGMTSLIDWENESSKMGLLLIIISMIFMNENETLADKNLWHTLAKFGIDPKDKNHKVFGDTDKLINQDFLKQNYLERSKIQGHEGVSFNYHIGPRARKEISKRKILEFVSEIYDKDSIELWKSQYQDVLESERQATDSTMEIDD